MFDLGFSELLLIAVVALVVLGPERLPKATRFAGLWVRRARAQWYSVKSELERELAADEMKRSLQETREAMRALDERSRSAGESVRREFGGMRDQVLHGLDPSSPASTVAPVDAAGDGGPGPHEAIGPGAGLARAPEAPVSSAPDAVDAETDDPRR
ncbi:MAG TPA: Sec-independent protein translocase protein TatB [Luteimonas sp.]|nr:Sec-independent protein translocase protein TatB [Luteimonas sp.]